MVNNRNIDLTLSFVAYPLAGFNCHLVFLADSWSFRHISRTGPGVLERVGNPISLSTEWSVWLAIEQVQVIKYRTDQTAEISFCLTGSSDLCVHSKTCSDQHSQHLSIFLRIYLAESVCWNLLQPPTHSTT